MRSLFLTALLFLFVTSCTEVQEFYPLDPMLAQQYVPGTEDLPVYKGFKLSDRKNIAYDSESGRIVDAVYTSSNANEEDVKNFYKKTLTQLGWNEKGNLSYVREGEVLKLLISKNKGITTLTFAIRPVA